MHERTVTEVVAALIWDEDKFLICQRPSHKTRALLWEFVGGKVEPGETKEQALVRECQEELAVTLSVGSVFMEVVHAYPDMTVKLTLFHAVIAEGAPQMLEHNDIRWITPSEIPQYDFCPADQEILEKIVREYSVGKAGVTIRKAQPQEADVLTALVLQLWSAQTAEEMKEELLDILIREDAAVYLAYDAQQAVGFAQCQLRRDYVEGTKTSPVGYLEGIYVAGDYRGRGIAGALLTACEHWAKDRGCTEFASDCELDNVQSLQFHRNVGFTEVNRIICFTKKL